eukprot:TRINITY_DN44192_c0_g1_i1.p1 TRINITY_DN44192_c0_g1~~TRINITY_DN44192_c0_g1_i1.p1  ORF type:complete len:280 (+),score=51.21 TRINITY_DN44192_c0_g1_i1:97-936(+)
MLRAVALLFAVSGLVAAQKHKGTMSMWSKTHDTLVGYKSEGSACKYGDKEMGGLKAPTAQTPYIKAKKYCAVNRGMFGGGEICGACYRLSFHGDHEQGLGHPGSEIIQVVDSGSWATFDCHMEAFHKITSYDTGFFPVTYERVACATPGGPVAGVLHHDYYISKLVFNNLRYPVKSATMTIGHKKYPLKLVGGWWHVWTGKVSGKVSFSITEDDGSHVTLHGCFGGWEKVKAGASCKGSSSLSQIGVDTDATLELLQSMSEGFQALLDEDPDESEHAAA